MKAEETANGAANATANTTAGETINATAGETANGAAGEAANATAFTSWERQLVQFKDPVYGYIGIPKVYAGRLIDTTYIQRLKGVAQSGMRPLFSAATHDRFSHSLGVYKFAIMSFAGLRTALLANIDSQPDTHLTDKMKKKLRNEINAWENLLIIAALIHDIGHPTGSHSFEFLYDDIFLQLDNVSADPQNKNVKIFNRANRNNNLIDVSTYDGWKKQWRYYERVYNDYVTGTSRIKRSYSDSRLKQAVRTKLLGKNNMEHLCGHPHEQMSVYMLYYEKELNAIIRSLIADNLTFLRGKTGPKAKTVNKTVNKTLITHYIHFIARMILGQPYHCTYSAVFDATNYVNSMKNCVIRLINGDLDSDSMDYIMRNSYSAGYATHKVDYDRLCAAFTVVENQHILESCFAKSALSVVEGFIIARNFEPKWLYSHHKVVYYDVLLKSLYHYAVKYLCFMDYQAFYKEINAYLHIDPDRRDQPESDNPARDAAVEQVLGKSSKSVIGKNRQVMSLWYYPYYTFVLSPRVPYIGQHYRFYNTVDTDLDALFKSIHLALINQSSPISNNVIFNESDREYFTLLLDEYKHRKLKKSLWKSYPEYTLFIQETADSLGLPVAAVHEYMLELIRHGLAQWSFGLAELKKDPDDKTQAEQIPKSYTDQYIYRPYPSNDVPKHICEPYNGIQFARMYAHELFGVYKDGDTTFDFSHNYCVCKIYTAKFKDFKNLRIKIDKHAYKISQIVNIPNETLMEFPYIFYTKKIGEGINVDADAVKSIFKMRFKTYCATRLSFEWGAKRGPSMDIFTRKQHVIRDHVHGDILFPDEYWDVVNAKEFQRLRRIKQLATASQVFPNATHTRFEHAIGTYHIMKQIVEHFQTIFKELQVDDIDTQDAPIALLAALLHDIGHGPFSHAFETVAENAISHEKWTELIILDTSTEVHQRIVSRFGAKMPQKIVNCMKHVPENDKTRLNFSMIYSGLISGSLDADRMDYLLRDAANTAAQYGAVDVQQIIAAMRIAQINGVYCVCFNEQYLSHIEQLIFSRYEMYSNVYFNNYKVLSETLVQCILQRAYRVRALLRPEAKAFLETIFDAKMSVKDFLALDEHTVNYFFQQWKSENRDDVLAEMCRSLLDRDGYQTVRAGNDTESDHQQLLTAIENIAPFKRDMLTDKKHRALFGIIKEHRRTSAYPDELAIKDISKTIWIMKNNGLIADFRDVTHLNTHRASDNEKHFWRVHKSYIFCNKTVLAAEIASLQDEMASADEKKTAVDVTIKEVEKAMRSFIPRNHIEIEEKYRCNKETLLDLENLLSCGDETLWPFKLAQGTGFSERLQEDIYFETADKLLEKNKCTLRIRKADDMYTCTVKLPVKSENFGGKSQLARFEYETTSTSSSLCAFADFINTHLCVNDMPLMNETITPENIEQLFHKTLIIVNNRKKATIVRGDGSDHFLCEVCLDNVTYKRGIKEKKDYQVEVELKSDYLHQIVLKIFTNKLEAELKDRLNREENSKYKRGLDMLNSSDE